MIHQFICLYLVDQWIFIDAPYCISCEVWDQLKHLREDREKLKEVSTGLLKFF